MWLCPARIFNVLCMLPIYGMWKTVTREDMYSSEKTIEWRLNWVTTVNWATATKAFFEFRRCIGQPSSQTLWLYPMGTRYPSLCAFSRFFKTFYKLELGPFSDTPGFDTPGFDPYFSPNKGVIFAEYCRWRADSDGVINSKIERHLDTVIAPPSTHWLANGGRFRAWGLGQSAHQLMDGKLMAFALA